MFPRPPSNPGAFDFKAYLAINGAFAGLKGADIEVLSFPDLGFLASEENELLMLSFLVLATQIS